MKNRGGPNGMLTSMTEQRKMGKRVSLSPKLLQSCGNVSGLQLCSTLQ